MSTATRERPARSTSARSVWDELAEQDALVDEARSLEPALKREKHEALGDLAVVRGRFEGSRARRDAADPVEHAELIEAKVNAEVAFAARDWEAEILGARVAAERASKRREAFLDARWPDLAGVLVERATRLRDAKRDAIAALIEVVAEERALGDGFGQILGGWVGPSGGRVRERLVGFGYGEQPLLTASRNRDARALSDAIGVLAKVDRDLLARAVPLALDTERGGVLPGAS